MYDIDDNNKLFLFCMYLPKSSCDSMLPYVIKRLASVSIYYTESKLCDILVIASDNLLPFIAFSIFDAFRSGIVI